MVPTAITPHIPRHNQGNFQLTDLLNPCKVIENWRSIAAIAQTALLVIACVACLFHGFLFLAAVTGGAAALSAILVNDIINLGTHKRLNKEYALRINDHRFQNDRQVEISRKLDKRVSQLSTEVEGLRATKRDLDASIVELNREKVALGDEVIALREQKEELKPVIEGFTEIFKSVSDDRTGLGPLVNQLRDALNKEGGLEDFVSLFHENKERLQALTADQFKFLSELNDALNGQRDANVQMIQKFAQMAGAQESQIVARIQSAKEADKALKETVALLELNKAEGARQVARNQELAEQIDKQQAHLKALMQESRDASSRSLKVTKEMQEAWGVLRKLYENEGLKEALIPLVESLAQLSLAQIAQIQQAVGSLSSPTQRPQPMIEPSGQPPLVQVDE